MADSLLDQYIVIFSHFTQICRCMPKFVWVCCPAVLLVKFYFFSFTELTGFFEFLQCFMSQPHKKNKSLA